MLEPGPREVHVWHAALPVPAEWARACRSLLSADERDREARTLAARARETFVVARGLLRALIGTYLGLPAGDIAFAYTPLGRPWLPPSAGRPPLQFSVSHSGGRVAIAFTQLARLGIDIERVRATPDCEAIAARFFARAERDALAALPGDARTSAFFSCWTRKEAVLKAVGLGISGGLRRVEVACGGCAPARIVRSEFPEIDPTEWTLLDLPMAGDFKGALAVAMTDPAVSIRDVPASVVLRMERTYNCGGSPPPAPSGPPRGEIP